MWIHEWYDIENEFLSCYASLFASNLPVFPDDLDGLIYASVYESVNDELIICAYYG